MDRGSIAYERRAEVDVVQQFEVGRSPAEVLDLVLDRQHARPRLVLIGRAQQQPGPEQGALDDVPDDADAERRTGHDVDGGPMGRYVRDASVLGQRLHALGTFLVQPGVEAGHAV